MYDRRKLPPPTSARQPSKPPEPVSYFCPAHLSEYVICSLSGWYFSKLWKSICHLLLKNFSSPGHMRQRVSHLVHNAEPIRTSFDTCDLQSKRPGGPVELQRGACLPHGHKLWWVSHCWTLARWSFLHEYGYCNGISARGCNAMQGTTFGLSCILLVEYLPTIVV